MPARRVFAWEPEEQWTSSEEREKKIEELSRELDESMDSNSGKGCLKAYLVKNEVWHIADIDYELRVDYRKYLKSTYSDSAVPVIYVEWIRQNYMQSESMPIR